MSLTRSGANLLPLAADMLQLEAHFRQTASGPLAFSGPFRFGVTELGALTWLPKLIFAIKEAYPDVVPEPEVDASVTLFKKLADATPLRLQLGGNSVDAIRSHAERLLAELSQWENVAVATKIDQTLA